MLNTLAIIIWGVTFGGAISSLSPPLSLSPLSLPVRTFLFGFLVAQLKYLCTSWFGQWSPVLKYASVAEWLRRQTQVLVLFEGVSSNLTGCSFLSLILLFLCFESHWSWISSPIVTLRML
jgi:hypothetical protein